MLKEKIPKKGEKLSKVQCRVGGEWHESLYLLVCQPVTLVKK